MTDFPVGVAIMLGIGLVGALYYIYHILHIAYLEMQDEEKTF